MASAAAINGLDAYVGTWQGEMEGLGTVVTRAAHIVHDGNVYLLAGIAPANQFRRGARRSRLDSLVPTLSASEAENIRPNRVDLYTVRRDETGNPSPKGSGGAVKPTTLAIMNNYDPSQPPRAGDRIKIVVEG